MNPLPAEVIKPINKKTFRKHAFKALIVQALLSFSLYFVIDFFDIDLITFDIAVYFVFVTFFNMFFVSFIFDYDIYRLRFKEVYPDSDFKHSEFILLGVSPILIVGMTLFLCLKNPDVSVRKAIKKRYLALAFILLLCLQVISPASTYLTGSASIYFVFDTSKSAERLTKFKKDVGSSEKVIEKYLNQNAGTVKATQIVLLLNAATFLSDEDRKREIASGGDKTEMRFKYGIKKLEYAKEVSLLSLSQRIKYINFSPIHWLLPSGPVEIILISKFEKEVLKTLRQHLHKNSLKYASKLEGQIEALSTKDRELYIQKLNDLKLHFKNN